MANKDDGRKIFRHYRKMSESQLREAGHRLERHTAKHSRIGIHTTPEHKQSIEYHLRQAKSQALKKKK